MAKPGRFSDDEIVNIRTIYANARRSSEALDPEDEDHETVLETEERLAGNLGISRSMVRRIVLGLAYANAGGPIDEMRLAADRGSREEVNATELTVERPGRAPRTFIYPGGTLVSVRAVVADLAEYTESGTPVSGSTSTSAKGKAARSRRPAASTDQETSRPPMSSRERDEAELKRLHKKMVDPKTPPALRPMIRNQHEALRARMHGYGDSDAGSSSGYAVVEDDL